MRKMASIQTISCIEPIQDADRIVKAKVNGWWVVTAKDNGFSVGDKIIYVEIDAFVPDSIAPFLSSEKDPPVEYNGIIGKKLSTRKMRGQVSQGLIMPVSILGDRAGDFNIGDDVSESLGIVKYVNDRYDHSMGEIIGKFPFFIPSTELVRIQNCFDEMKEKYSHFTFEVTTKMNGSSLTCYFNNGTVGVCSKDIEYKYHRKNFDNPYVLFGKRILDLLFRNGENMAIQGELCGPMRYLQNNERLDGPKIFVFNVFDIDNQKSFLPYDRREFIEDNFDFIVENVPLIHKSLKLDDFKTIDDLIAFADGESYEGGHRREGVVFKSNDYDDNGKIVSFKIISNKFLLKEGWQ